MRYYITYTEEARAAADAHRDLTKVATSPPFDVYELPPNSPVDVARFVPAVYTGDRFDEAALDWYDRQGRLDQWMVEEGPRDWPEVGDDLVGLGTEPIEGGGRVSQVVVKDHRISFRTTAVGVPHLVKVSYFPNWRAVGAEGPYRAAPALMVVVPTDEEVVLEFRSTWAEQLGVMLSAAGVLILVIGGFLSWRERRG